MQIDGKLRDALVMAKGLPKDEIESAVAASDKIVRALEGKTPRKLIVVSIARSISSHKDPCRSFRWRRARPRSSEATSRSVR